MDERSWMRLDAEPSAHALPRALAAHDPLGGRDIGWVTQMQPFVRHFSRPGDTVFDPFAGAGTTLLAAQLEGRQALGCEVDAGRVALIGQRFAQLGLPAPPVIASSCDQLGDEALPRFDLCLSNVPYFGCDWPGEAQAGQLYGSDSYAAHLAGLRAVFHRVGQRLPEGGFCIAMVQNLRLGGRMLPLAFDLAQILGSLFVLQEERVIVYERPGAAGAALPAFDTRTDRSHEYALIARKQREAVDLHATAALLRALRAEGHAFTLFGSFARWLADPASATPADADLRVAADEATLGPLLAALAARGFALHSWGERVPLPLVMAPWRGRHYFRATRVDRQGRRVQLDLCYE
ncbi:DNA methyltransferase [Xenophilus arseniciresistens]|uniref:Methyltransferase n=1 Tax=Xenophilus arseniciresistens TaxID=1283306 RepID=A0AAE3SX36_9BURK|nr:DNA methyltransferase [Xenophilus arseniciresistens]MDA7414737.1 DNA methyltransferase [Xenophilus arseniciresistens]